MVHRCPVWSFVRDLRIGDSHCSPYRFLHVADLWAIFRWCCFIHYTRRCSLLSSSNKLVGQKEFSHHHWDNHRYLNLYLKTILLMFFISTSYRSYSTNDEQIRFYSRAQRSFWEFSQCCIRHWQGRMFVVTAWVIKEGIFSSKPNVIVR